MASLEQQVRDMLERAGVDDAQSFTAGDLVELSNVLHRVERLKKAIKDAHTMLLRKDFAGLSAILVKAVGRPVDLDADGNGVLDPTVSVGAGDVVSFCYDTGRAYMLVTPKSELGG